MLLGHPAIRDYDAFMEIVQKSLTSSDFASAGKLVPMQGSSYIDLVKDASHMKSVITIVQFNQEQGYIELINQDGRFLSVEAEETDPVTRRKATPIRRTLQPTRFLGILQVSDWVYDIQIEKESIMQTLMRHAAARTANDIDRLILMGNENGCLFQDPDESGYTASKWKHDTFMESVNGVIQIMLASSNVVDVSSFTTKHLSPMVCAQMIRALSELKLPLLPDMRFFANPLQIMDYRFYMGQQGAENTEKWWIALYAPAKFQNILIEEVSLLSEFPNQCKVASFTSGGTVVVDHPPVVAGSDKLILDSETTYQTPYDDTTDYTLVDATGVITHGTDGAMPTGEDITIHYKGSGICFLTNPKNLFFAIARDDVEMEPWRDPIKGLNYIIVRTRGDAAMGDYDAGVICKGMTSKGYSAIT